MKKSIAAKFKKILSLLLTAILLLSTISGGVLAANPKVSIIIPVYNTPENFLRKCLSSAKNQTLKDIEIICVDDGSTDNSGKVLDEYAKNDPRFKVVHQENKGTAAARNRALDLAKGEYIKFVDSDDYIELTTLEECYKSAVAYCADVLRHNCKKISNCCVFNEIKFMREAIWCCMYKTKFLNDHNIKFEESVKYLEDYLFQANVMTCEKKVLCIAKRCYNYCRKPNSLCNNKNFYQIADNHMRATLNLYQNWKENKYLDNSKYKRAFLSLLLVIMKYNDNKKLNNFNERMLSELDDIILQDDAINLLPLTERIQLRNIITNTKSFK